MHPGCITVTGKPLEVNVAGAKTKDPEVIRPLSNPYSAQGGLSVLYGNLAPEGAVVKTAGVDPKMLVFEGSAVIFESQEEACEGILAGKVKAGDFVVIRYEGPKGGPGMQEMLAPTSYIMGEGLGDKVAMVTDGRFSGGTHGAVIGHVSPEAAAGGPIGLVKPGDRIRLDIPARKLDLLVSDGGTRGTAQELEDAEEGGPRGLPGEIRLHGHQRQHRRGPEVGLTRAPW